MSRRDDQIASLRDLLLQANRDTARSKLAQIAAQFGAAPPDDLRDATLLLSLEQRAQFAAESIYDTQVKRLEALLDASGGDAAWAQAQHRVWWQDQSTLIAETEANWTAGEVTRQFIGRNAGYIGGTARVMPQATAGLGDACDHAVEQGEVAVSAITIQLPAHPRCPHYWALDALPVYDPSVLWTGA